ncbi:MAG: valine--tRNA ligase [Actinomycetota bacterium]
MSDIEASIRDFWEKAGVYRYDPTRGRDETFVIDTPPPTVSGSLHIGHVFSYAHTDMMARHRRMRGDNIFYPMGWDDNGLPTERRVQNVFNVRPSPSEPYNPDLKLELGRKGETLAISRPNFIELCDAVLKEDEKQFQQVLHRMAYSVDWSYTYATIDRHCRRLSQLSFLRLIERGEAELREGPTMWDIDFQTALSQAEVEDREEEGFYNRIRFGVEGESHDVVIATTRPELLGACIAVIAHPEDDRYRLLFGKQAVTPLYGATVPILAHETAEPDKGTGIMMVCTFGDASDVERHKELEVPPRVLIGRDGRVRPVPWGESQWQSLQPDKARRWHDKLVGLTLKEARQEVVRQLGEVGALVGPPEKVRRPVKFFEKGYRPLEYVSSRQWYVRLLAHKEALLAQGRKVQWHPESMLKRYENWVEGLNQDWAVSRQRPFGVPIPVWYGVGEGGEIDHDHLLLPHLEDLPVDPSSDTPPGYDDSQRGKAGGFEGDPDVFDTWATSSLTPILLSGWPDDLRRHQRLYPGDLRPNAHDIIRTWDFYTIVRSYLEDGSVPWRHAAISGFVTDPDRKKMSKSKGNVVLPTDILDAHGPDAVRYWAASAKLGMDAAIDSNIFREGKRLVTKIRNASRFVLGFEGDTGPPTRPLDRALIARLRDLATRATTHWDAWDHAGALQVAENWFWADFCDNYLELVKDRAYRGDAGAVGTLRRGLDVVLRLFAPVLPYVTEEVWQAGSSERLPPVPSLPASEAGRSVHRARWPDASELEDGLDDGCFAVATGVLSHIRKAKSDAKVSLRAPVDSLTVRGPASQLALLEEVLDEIIAAGNIHSHQLVPDEHSSELLARAQLGKG